MWLLPAALLRSPRLAPTTVECSMDRVENRRAVRGKEICCGFLALMTVAGIAGASAANAMTMTSLGIKPGGKIAAEQVSNGCDSTGKNVSPALAWSGAPKGTKRQAGRPQSRRSNRVRG